MTASDAVPQNMMQRLLCKWENVHPYNAAQVMRLDPGPDHGAAQAAWDQALRNLGLGKLRWEGPRFWFDSADVPAGSVACVPPGVGLEAYLSDEMNRRFETADALPLRPFLLRENQAHYAGVVYRHWIADSTSIRMLMRQWLVCMVDPARAAPRPLAITPDGYWRLLGPDAAHWRLDTAAMAAVRNFSALRRVRRVQTRRADDFRMRFLLRRLPAGALIPLRQAARGAGVTLTDLLLAVMAGVCGRWVPARPAPRRRDLAMGTIMDLRQRGRHDLANSFGLFLGYQSFVLRRDMLDDWPRLLAHVAAQSRRHKDAGPSLTMLWAAAALVWEHFIPPAQIPQACRKLALLAATVSSVNLNDSPRSSALAEYHPRPLREYLRVSPTGPLEPLMFTATTLGDEFHLGLTYRAAIIPDADARQLADEVVARLLRLAEHGASRVT